MLQEIQVLVIEILRTLEHQVLKQVGKAGAARDFIFGTDVVPDVDGDYRSLVVFVDNQCQSIVEHEFAIGDIDILGGSIEPQPRAETD